MLEIKIVPYEDKENQQQTYFLNPLLDIKKAILQADYEDFEQIAQIVEYLKIFNPAGLKSHKEALIIGNKRFECFSL